MKSIKLVLFVFISFVWSNVALAHHSIVPHSHENADISHSSIVWAVIFTLVAIMAIIISASRYFNTKEQNHK